MTISQILKLNAQDLKLFESSYIKNLDENLILKKDKYFLKCLVREREIQVYSSSKSNPEEIIRQLYLLKLHHEYKYAYENMRLEVDVVMGSSSKKADIIIYDNAAKKDKENIVLIIEIKKPKEDMTKGIGQLESYISALPTQLGIWTDGNEENVRYRNPDNKDKFERFKKVPKSNESIASVLKTYLKKSDLINIVNLYRTVYMLEQRVLANDGVNAFDELFKLIFAKLYDEQSKKSNDELDFQVKFGQDITITIVELFSKAKNKWKDVFKEKDEIELSQETLIAVVSELQEYKLFETDFEILDAAFEHMISGDSKGEKGQYFTPRPVIDIIVKMMHPQDDEKVLDPSAGSAGFLLHTFQYVLNNKIIEEKDRYRYAVNNLFAIDFDPRTVKIAKALMVIAGDGSTNASHVNSLDKRVWDKNSKAKFDNAIASKYKEENFEIIMTNPPFAGDVSSSSGYLGYYELARDSKHKTKSSEKRDLLFIERNINFLAKGGRMAIVLPQGRFNNSSDREIREYITKYCRILGVVGLHGNSFKPYTGTKTSILIVQKWDDVLCPFTEDYPIFFATNTKPVKDNSGNYVGKTTKKTIAKTDLNEISEAFLEFGKKEGFSFLVGK